MVVFFLTGTKALVIWLKKEKTDTPHDLEGCLHTLHDILLMGKGRDDTDPCLRITIHVPVDNGQNLQQVTNYVGDQRRKGAKGRKFPSQSGIIGKVFREKHALVARRKNFEHPLGGRFVS